MNLSIFPTQELYLGPFEIKGIDFNLADKIREGSSEILLKVVLTYSGLEYKYQTNYTVNIQIIGGVAYIKVTDIINLSPQG